jgi:hypothetical protein
MLRTGLSKDRSFFPQHKEWKKLGFDKLSPNGRMGQWPG